MSLEEGSLQADLGLQPVDESPVEVVKRTIDQRFKIVIGRSGQTMYDVAIQHYGDCSGIDWILNDNPEIDGSSVIEDVKILIRKNELKNKLIHKHLSNTTITTY